MRYRLYKDRLSSLESEERLRRIPEEMPEGFVDLSSNDYMGLAEDSDSLPLCWDGLPESLRSRYESLISKYGDHMSLLGNPGMWSASASRLLMGRQRIPRLLEDVLEADYGRPALLFNSGYHANVGVIGALNDSGVVFLVDKLMHASAYDGLRACGARFDRFRHNDPAHLEKLIIKHNAEAGEKKPVLVVVTEAVFSMDGDRAPLRSLVGLRRKYPNLLLYVDEAHAYGCFGNRGLGLCEEEGVIEETDILVGTFGKAAASAGAFVVTPAVLRETMINSARSFIFSTALPPAVYLRSLESHLRLRGASERRRNLQEISTEIRKRIEERFGPTPSQSHIIPIITGDAGEALRLAGRLRDKGIIALPIRRPTVPPGGERVRISLSALHKSSPWSNFEE